MVTKEQCQCAWSSPHTRQALLRLGGAGLGEDLSRTWPRRPQRPLHAGLSLGTFKPRWPLARVQPPRRAGRNLLFTSRRGLAPGHSHVRVPLRPQAKHTGTRPPCCIPWASWVQGHPVRPASPRSLCFSASHWRRGSEWGPRGLRGPAAAAARRGLRSLCAGRE
jgi:hypothetical protein